MLKTASCGFTGSYGLSRNRQRLQEITVPGWRQYIEQLQWFCNLKQKNLDIQVQSSLSKLLSYEYPLNAFSILMLEGRNRALTIIPSCARFSLCSKNSFSATSNEDQACCPDVAGCAFICGSNFCDKCSFKPTEHYTLFSSYKKYL